MSEWKSVVVDNSDAVAEMYITIKLDEYQALRAENDRLMALVKRGVEYAKAYIMQCDVHEGIPGAERYLAYFESWGKSETDQLRARIAEIEAENFKLAAGMCVHPVGVVGDEGGSPVCPLQGRITELEGELHARSQYIKEWQDRYGVIFDALATAQEARKWLPIESAPRSGESVLVALDSRRVCIAGWDGEKHWVNDSGYRYRINPPTHWMPMPKGPEES